MRRPNLIMVIASGVVLIFVTSMWISSPSDTGNKRYSNESLIQQILDQQRKTIEEEMKNYMYPAGKYNVSARNLEYLVPEQGGNPIRTVIMSTWRSGSSFLGELVSSHPGTYYHFEPLLPSRYLQIGKDSPIAEKSYSTLRHLLHCNYTGLNEEYFTFDKDNRLLNKRNRRLMNALGPNQELSWDAAFLSNICRLFPFQSMKVVRLRLEVAAKLLEDKSLNVRMILLVRDPRGTMNSRSSLIWCKNNPRCIEPKKLCKDLVDDYWSAVKLRELSPNRFRILRYEDFSVNVANSTKSVFEFLGLAQGTGNLDDETILHPKVIQFLKSHTNKNEGGKMSTRRDIKQTAFNWIRMLNPTQISKIQSSCTDAIYLWGYNEMAVEVSPGKTANLSKSTDIADFNPVGNFE